MVRVVPLSCGDACQGHAYAIAKRNRANSTSYGARSVKRLPTFLLFAIQTCTQNKMVLHRVWSARFAVIVSMAIIGIMYYNL